MILTESKQIATFTLQEVEEALRTLNNLPEDTIIKIDRSIRLGDMLRDDSHKEAHKALKNAHNLNENSEVQITDFVDTVSKLNDIIDNFNKLLTSVREQITTVATAGIRQRKSDSDPWRAGGSLLNRE